MNKYFTAFSKGCNHRSQSIQDCIMKFETLDVTNVFTNVGKIETKSQLAL